MTLKFLIIYQVDKKRITQNYKLHVCDLSDKETVYKILSEQNYDLVMHFAASINVEESY